MDSISTLNQRYSFILGLITTTLLAVLLTTQTANAAPRLVLQITIDQLRGDLPTRYYNRLSEGGFRYLWEKGVVYRNAHHPHANTETVVGHTTLATGTTPSIHGMIGNVWFDRETGQTTYNVEDPRYRLLTKGAGVDAKTEIDPTQRVAKSEGRSPAAILVSTFADELRSYTNGQSKVFGVSIKDRGAIAMAGHSGKAFWFSKKSGEFVTSTYYFNEYPAWASTWNAQKKPQRYAETSWQLLHDQSSYLFAATDDRAWETDLAGFGRVFPHAYGKGDGKYFNTLLTLSPAGDALTLDFAKTLLVEEQLGQDTITDYLSVSFSSTDYVGHMFGPSSLEAEDNILRLDRQLAELFEFVDQRVGLSNTLIVLSADHGGPDSPDYLKRLKIPAGYVQPEAWDKEAAIGRIKQRFNITGPLIESYQPPYLYLSQAVLNDTSIDRAVLEAAIIDELSSFPGIALAVSSTALRHGNVPDTWLYRSVLNNFHAKRSGDIYIVFEPNWFINDFDGLRVAVTHGSPWRYDTFVPIVFAGAEIQPRHVFRQVSTVDIAPTLSAYIGTKPPSGAIGKLLVELFDSADEQRADR
jgi:predicted AlkP superfamily pyrophosphatase or phosphodiesterase